MSPEIEHQPGAGVPDDWQRIWMPERLAYIKGETKSDDCPFCVIPAMSDDDGLIVHRGTLAYVVLNLFPYNAGHTMTVPFRHVADYTELSAEETVEVDYRGQKGAFFKRDYGSLVGGLFPELRLADRGDLTKAEGFDDGLGWWLFAKR